MANYADLKAAVNAVIKTNGNQAITGQVLQNVLNTIISTIGENATLKGIAVPTTNPGNPDANVFYLAIQSGNYVNFNNSFVGYGEIAILYNENSGWNVSKLPILNALFPVSISIANSYLNNSGAIIGGATGYSISDYINVWENNDYFIYNLNLGTPNVNICFYDKNKKFVSAVNSSVFNGSVTTPTNVRYMRLSGTTSSVTISQIIPKTNTGISDTLGYKQDIWSSDNDITRKVLIAAKDLYGDIFTFNGFLNASGTINGDNNFKTSDFLQLDGNNITGIATTYGANVASFAYYDANKVFIRIGQVNPELFTVSQSDIPENATYIRVCVRNNQLNYAFVIGVKYSLLDAIKALQPKVNTDYLVYSNNLKDEAYKLPEGTKIYSADGTVEPDLSNYGQPGKILAIPFPWTGARKDSLFIRFKVKFNDDMNVRNPALDYSDANNYLNFGAFERTTVSELYRLRFIARPEALTGAANNGIVSLYPSTKLGTANYNKTGINVSVFDNVSNKTIAGGLALKIRIVDNANTNVFVSNKDGILKVYDSVTNVTITQYVLANYATMDALYNAMKTDSAITCDFYGLTGRTPSELQEFDGVRMVSVRNCKFYGNNGNLIKTESVNDNAYIYIRYKNDENWHTVEIIADSSISNGLLCSVIDGMTQNSFTQRSVSELMASDSYLFLGGRPADGVTVNCSFKDLEVRYNNLGDNEVFTGYFAAGKPTVITEWTPRLYLMMAHTMMNTTEDEPIAGASQSVDTVASILDYAKSKGYKPITMEDIFVYLKTGYSPVKRGVCIMYDDWQMPVYLNDKYKKIHTQFGMKPCLALYENVQQPNYEYGGVTYEKKELALRLIREGWSISLHGQDEVFGDVSCDEIQRLLKLYKDKGNQLNFPVRYLTYGFGSTNVMVNSEVMEAGFDLGVMTEVTTSLWLRRGTPAWYVPRISINKDRTIDFYKTFFQ